MKKSILFAILIMSAVSSFSAQIRCKMDVNVIGAGGLMPADKATIWQTELQSGLSATPDKCSNYLKPGNQSMSLCARTTEAVGVYQLGVFTNDGTEEADATMGTSIKNNQNLVMLQSTHLIFSDFKRKMRDLNLKTPARYIGDSLLLDEVIVKANKKSKVSLVDMPVTMGFESCEILK